MYLTKSDFRVARTCATKLYYKKLGFASLEDDDPYLEFLADGGYMLEKMARLLFPDGKEIGFWAQPEKALEATRLTVNAGDCTLFEATVVSGNLLARIDILRRDGNALQLIEVKSSSIDSDEDGLNPFRGTNGDILSDWRPYLEDVTFQTIVLTRAFPAFRVVPFLCVVNKARTATPNMTFDKFRLCRSDVGDSQWRPKVDYHGDVRQLQNEHVLAIVNVSSEFEELAGEVEVSAEEFVATLESEPIRRVRPEIGQKCKGCEYRLPRGTTEHNGFCECWGALGEFEPHVLDLYRVDLLGGKNRDVVAELAAMGQARLSNVPMNLLSGTSACRQRIQLEYTLAGREYVAPELWQILSDHPYPLHFIDFEGSRLAVPYHSGMRPYEQAAFQWSCHRIRFRGAALEHAEWLNTDDAFPNFAFARTLKDQIGDEGTVYIWSHYEVDILCEIRDQMEKYAYNDRDLAAWIDRLRSKETSRVVDLCALAKAYYFHPLMKGSLSIKKVFPAVWSVDEALRAHSCFSKYTKYDGNGRLLDPYAALPPLPVGEKEEVVTEGTGAMRLYQEMMFGRVKGDETLRQNYRKLLLQYCELDTAAMVVIWMRWASPEI